MTDSSITLGPGWREVPEREFIGHGDGDHVVSRTGGVIHFFLREEPVPPLPTQPYTVIRATWIPGGDGAVKETYVLTHALKVWTNVNTGVQHSPDELRGGITGFEVLSEPRAVTAKAVLDRIWKWYEAPTPKGFTARETFSALGREFGVDQ